MYTISSFINMAKCTSLSRFQFVNGELFFFFFNDQYVLEESGYTLVPSLFLCVTLLQLVVASQYRTGYKVGEKLHFSYKFKNRI